MKFCLHLSNADTEYEYFGDNVGSAVIRSVTALLRLSRRTKRFPSGCYAVSVRRYWANGVKRRFWHFILKNWEPYRDNGRRRERLADSFVKSAAGVGAPVRLNVLWMTLNPPERLRKGKDANVSPIPPARDQCDVLLSELLIHLSIDPRSALKSVARGLGAKAA